MMRQGNEREQFFSAELNDKEVFSALLTPGSQDIQGYSGYEPFSFVTLGVYAPLLQDPPGPSSPPETPKQPIPSEEPTRPPAPETPRQPIPQEEPLQPGAPEHPPRQVPPEHPDRKA